MKKILSAGLMLALLSFAFISKADRTITGTIKDNKGHIISFATIKAQGTNIVTTSDANGKFTITISDTIKTLEISCIGYKTMAIKLTGKPDYAVALKPLTSKLDEVVVTGYSTATEDMAANTYAPSFKQKASGNISYNKVYRFTAPQIVKDEEVDDSWRYNGDFNTEGYAHIVDNPFLKTNDNPLSTFSIDVDAASYSNIRRILQQGNLPPAGAVRIEDLLAARDVSLLLG